MSSADISDAIYETPMALQRSADCPTEEPRTPKPGDRATSTGAREGHLRCSAPMHRGGSSCAI